MKRLIFIISLFISVSFQGQGLISFGTIAASGSSWVDRMAISYVSINSHSTFTQTQIDTIKDRLAEVQAVFGPLGQNKTVCDFFLFFENSNKTTNLITRINTKTGATLLWDYGAISYSQNNLPAQINNGVITVTSTDGFAAWTYFDISANTFINAIPSFQYFTGLSRLYCYTNQLNGNFPDLIGNTVLTRLRIYSNKFTGKTPNFVANSVYDVEMQANDFTLNGTENFDKAMTLFYLDANNFTIAELDNLLLKMDNFYVGANLMIADCVVQLHATGMPIPTGGNNNVNRLSLLAKATAAGKTWTIIIRTE